MKALRILMTTRGLPFHTLGGMEAVAWDIARAFSLAGAEVTILTTATDELPPESIVEGVRILCLSTPRGRYSRDWWRESRRAFESRLRHEADVVLSVSASARSMARGRKPDGPVFIVQAHGTAWGEFVSKVRQGHPVAWLKSLRNLIAMFQDVAYRRFDAFIAVGETVARDLQRAPTRQVIGNLPVHLVPNGVAEERFAFNPYLREKNRAALGLDAEARVILSASRLHRQKGIMEGIAAFEIAAAQDERLHFIIAGDGPDAKRLHCQAGASSAAKRIHFIGNIPRDAIRGWLSAADLFLFTTKRVEGLPLNILEARAAGLPVIASSQVVEPEFGATAVDPTQPGQIAHAILAARPVPPAERRSLLPERFSLATATASYLEIFENLSRKPRLQNAGLLA